jgi:protein gp37
MSDHSKIEWTNASWNPTAGCTRCSSGCANCYAIGYAHRMASNPNAKVSAVSTGLTRKRRTGLDWTGTVRCLPGRLADPFKWAKPRLVFVNSMSDPFHEDVPLSFLRPVFDVMGVASWHTYQILTKRAERLEALSASLPWPDNVWMGVSVENQENAWRVDHLRRTGARVKFLSVEPLLGPVTLDLPGIDWVITGGESGPRARPFDPAWAAAVREQCRAAGVRFFHKQNGGKNKKKSGRLLDGRTYDEMPAARAEAVPSWRERTRLAGRFTPPTSARVELTTLDPGVG